MVDGFMKIAAIDARPDEAWSESEAGDQSSRDPPSGSRYRDANSTTARQWESQNTLIKTSYELRLKTDETNIGKEKAEGSFSLPSSSP